MTASDLRPPSRFALIGEARIAVEWTVMRLAVPLLRRWSPPGGGEPVLVASPAVFRLVAERLRADVEERPRGS